MIRLVRWLGWLVSPKVVWVVMYNDFPESVWSTKQGAADEVKRLHDPNNRRFVRRYAFLLDQRMR